MLSRNVTDLKNWRELIKTIIIMYQWTNHFFSVITSIMQKSHFIFQTRGDERKKNSWADTSGHKELLEFMIIMPICGYFKRGHMRLGNIIHSWAVLLLSLRARQASSFLSVSVSLLYHFNHWVWENNAEMSLTEEWLWMNVPKEKRKNSWRRCTIPRLISETFKAKIVFWNNTWRCHKTVI